MKTLAKILWALVLAVFALILIVSCSEGSEETNQDEVIETETTRTDVQWENYAPEVKIRIDEMMEARDCEGLQAQFDISDANSQATMNRVGHNNASLMGYTDEAMRIAGCY
jgi:hypothetical protein